MQRSSNLTKKLAAYSAAATLAVGAGLAHGADRLTVVNQMVSGNTLDINFDGASGAEFFVSQTSAFAYFGVGGNMGDVGLSFMTDGLGYVARLASGDPIPGSAFASGSNGTALLGYSSTSGNWPGQSGYVGVRFSLQGTIFSGWIELSVDNFSSEITVIRYYFEDASPNTGLNAGETPTAVTMNNIASSTASNPVGVVALLTGALTALSGIGLWVRRRILGGE